MIVRTHDKIPGVLIIPADDGPTGGQEGNPVMRVASLFSSQVVAARLGMSIHFFNFVLFIIIPVF